MIFFFLEFFWILHKNINYLHYIQTITDILTQILICVKSFAEILFEILK